MNKKKLILSQKQINEIIGEEWNVNADCMSDDSRNNGSDEILSTSNMSDGTYAEPVTTDRIAHDLNVSDISAGLWKNGGVNGAIYTLREWKKKRLNETNQDFFGRKTTFSPTAKKNIGNAPEGSAVANAINNGVDVSRLADIVHDFKDAKENGDISTLNRMGGINAYDEIEKLYGKEKSASKNRRNAKPEGHKIESGPKEVGNGKGHPKTAQGVVTTWFNPEK